MGPDPRASKTPEQIASEKLKADFAKALDVGFWEGLTKENHEIIAARTPDQVIDAFATVKPEWKNALEIIKNDPELSTSVHAALAKDPTMLEGLTGMMTEMGGINPNEFAQTLSDPRARKGLAAALNKIANEEKYTFTDFKELYDKRNDQGAVLAKLQAMGVNPTTVITGDDMFAMLKDFFNDPQGFMNKLSGMMGLTGAQGEAMGKLFNGMGFMAEVVLGGDGGYRNMYNQFAPPVTQFVKDITGMTDQERAAQQTTNATGATTDPDIQRRLVEAGTGETIKSGDGIDVAVADSADQRTGPVMTSPFTNAAYAIMPAVGEMFDNAMSHIRNANIPAPVGPN